MSRIILPVAKLARSLSSAPVLARASPLLSNGPRAPTDLARKNIDSSAAGARNPVATERKTPRTRRLMQSFHTAALPAVHMELNPIDAFVLPSFYSPGGGRPAALADPTAMAMRMPLLPDNYHGRHEPEPPQPPVMGPEISVVAGSQSNVLPAAALTEVEGIGVDGVELKFVHEADESSSSSNVGVFGGPPIII